jgi:hypothetical protein
MRDLDAIGGELYWRRFPYDADRVEEAVATLTHVCDGFLDADELDNLDRENALAIIDGRPEPGLDPNWKPKAKTVVSIASHKKTAKRKRTA